MTKVLKHDTSKIIQSDRKRDKQSSPGHENNNDTRVAYSAFNKKSEKREENREEGNRSIYTLRASIQPCHSALMSRLGVAEKVGSRSISPVSRRRCRR